jgi:acyl-CoA thioesterase
MLETDFYRAVQERFHTSPFNEWFGTELIRFGDGEIEVALEVKEHHLNPGGIIHGGVIASLLDIAIGLALRTRLSVEFAHVTTQLQINYLKPCRSGRVTATGTAIHQGRRTGYGEASLVDQRGRLLARANGAFLIFPMSDVGMLGAHSDAPPTS